MIKNILLIFFLILIVVLGTSAGILGYLYSTKNSDYNKLLAESMLKPEEPTVETVSKQISFTDESLEINFKYLDTWNLSLDTKVSEDFAYDPVYGRVLQQYQATLTKGTSALEFKKVLGAVDGFPNKVKEADMDFVKVNTKLVRYKEKSETKWRYAEELDCADFADYFGSPAASDEICVSTFYPGFGIYANTATVSSTKSEDLVEADAIAVSALN